MRFGRGRFQPFLRARRAFARGREGQRSAPIHRGDGAAPGAPAHEQLRALADRKLPEVDALIARAQAMREWLTTASDCGCDSLESCALFVAAGATTGEAVQAVLPATPGVTLQQANDAAA